MGKGKQKDRLYMKPSEYADGMGGKRETGEGPRFRHLPFNHCALSFEEIEQDGGVFTEDGSCFRAACLTKYVRKHKAHPTTGKPLDENEIYVLHVHKNDAGEYHCPITAKPFTDHTHVVAVRTTGNAFSYDAVNELNIKPKNWTDLLTGVPFKRSDIIGIQDPHKMLETRNVFGFHHMKAKEEEEGQPAAAKSGREGDEAGGAPPAKRQKKEKKEKKEKKGAREGEGKQVYSTSGTSTVTLRADALDTPEVAAQKELFRQVRALGGDATANARLETSVGDLDVKLHCGACPKTCFNFIQLAKQGYYAGTTFHRVIKGFMMQGGDPTATGGGGASIWGKPFEDEVTGNPHRHTGRGVLSMANSGPDSNGSQFFVTFGAAPHLDGKHTVFGQVVMTQPCMKTLDDVELIPTDSGDRPRTKVVLERVDVYRDPFASLQGGAAAKAPKKKKIAADSAEGQERRQWFSAPQPAMANSGSSSVGKYLQQGAKAKAEEAPSKAKPSALLQTLGAKKGGFDFSGW